MSRLRVDLIHFPIVYFFHSGSDSASMATAIDHIDRFARQAGEPGRTSRTRLIGAALDVTLEQCAEVLCSHYDHMDPHDRLAVFLAYAEHHVTKLGK